MVVSVPNFVEDISNEMQLARSFEDRWKIITSTLKHFGATAVNAASIDARTASPNWFRSSLSHSILSGYVDYGHFENDLIVRHAATSGRRLLWRTNEVWYQKKITKPQVAFTNFVRDSGYRSILSISMPGAFPQDVSNLTFCSQISDREVLVDDNLKGLRVAMGFLLPWIGWPERQDSAEFVQTTKYKLTVREVDALSFLAGGLMNTRIAEAMGVSEGMVAKHLFSAKRKLGARTREQAIAIAIRRGQIRL